MHQAVFCRRAMEPGPVFELLTPMASDVWPSFKEKVT
jgi:hypothetical protein